MRLHRLKIVSIFLLLLSVPAFSEGRAHRFTVLMNRMVTAINSQDFPPLRQDYSADMLRETEKLEAFFRKQVVPCGKIVRVESPRLVGDNMAVFPTHFETAFFDVKIALNDNGKIAGLWFLPHTADIPVPKENFTVLHLPFQGQWLVFWGGDTLALNHHHGNPAQNFAFDFLIVDKEGHTHRNDGRKNEDYYAFGKPVLASANGVVTDVIRGVRDNIPGLMNPYSALGNAVIIQHAPHEVSVLAHFKQNSIRVQVGQKVRAGQILGLCGNSGNSSEPHIHYHLQNTPIMQDARGIKCFFTNIVVSRNGKTQTEKRHSPVKNDFIENKR